MPPVTSATSVIQGLSRWAVDCSHVLPWLRSLPAGSVHCVVTSPPYWGLRDYETEGQIGVEETPEEYVANLVEVFTEVCRTLRDDGTLWLNLGDTYINQGGHTKQGDTSQRRGRTNVVEQHKIKGRKPVSGLKTKDLVGVPWMVAFALRAEGWYLRSDVIWSKNNPMPESVRDRPTRAHEYLFLLTKKDRYFYDAEAVKEPAAEPERQRTDRVGGANGHTVRHSLGGLMGASSTRNLRSVWAIPTSPYPGAHFATFPPKLVTPCIKAGTSERGCCRTCGNPWRRILKRERKDTRPALESKVRDLLRYVTTTETVGWEPTCQCGDEETVSAIMMDPFGGAATTVLVANRLGRRGIACDLNPKYVEMARRRVREDGMGIS